MLDFPEVHYFSHSRFARTGLAKADCERKRVRNRALERSEDPEKATDRRRDTENTLLANRTDLAAAQTYYSSRMLPKICISGAKCPDYPHGTEGFSDGCDLNALIEQEQPRNGGIWFRCGFSNQ
jgi:hypothetical protein